MLMQVGGPSQIDLFDPKPELQKRDGQKHPGDVETLQPGSETKKLMASPFRFRRHGECGHGVFGIAPRDRLGAPTTCAWSARCTATTTTTPRPRAA